MLKKERATVDPARAADGLPPARTRRRVGRGAESTPPAAPTQVEPRAAKSSAHDARMIPVLVAVAYIPAIGGLYVAKKWDYLLGAVVLGVAATAVVAWWSTRRAPAPAIAPVATDVVAAPAVSPAFGQNPAVLTTMGLRLHGLIATQLAKIDELESEERDPVALSNLFALDHLATRINRSAAGLLVLAGEDSPRPWGPPVPLAEALRGAVGEIDDFQRVDVSLDGDAYLLGAAVIDVVHLLAELVENGARFSPSETRVVVHGRLVDDGYLVSVCDRGQGLAVEDIDTVNRALATVDQGLPGSAVLGFRVVATLAARLTARVWATRSIEGGLDVSVLLPLSLLVDVAPEAQLVPAAPVAAPVGTVALPGTADYDAPQPVTNSYPAPQQRADEPSIAFDPFQPVEFAAPVDQAAAIEFAPPVEFVPPADHVEPAAAAAFSPDMTAEMPAVSFSPDGFVPEGPGAPGPLEFVPSGYSPAATFDVPVPLPVDFAPPADALEYPNSAPTFQTGTFLPEIPAGGGAPEPLAFTAWDTDSFDDYAEDAEDAEAAVAPVAAAFAEEPAVFTPAADASEHVPEHVPEFVLDYAPEIVPSADAFADAQPFEVQPFEVQPFAVEPAASYAPDVASEFVVSESLAPAAVLDPAAAFDPNVDVSGWADAIPFAPAESPASVPAEPASYEPAAYEPTAFAPAEPAAFVPLEPAAFVPAEPAAYEPAAFVPAEPAAYEPAAFVPAEPAAYEPAAFVPAEPAAYEPAAFVPAEPAAYAAAAPAEVAPLAEVTAPDPAELTTVLPTELPTWPKDEPVMAAVAAAPAPEALAPSAPGGLTRRVPRATLGNRLSQAGAPRIAAGGSAGRAPDAAGSLLSAYRDGLTLGRNGVALDAPDDLPKGDDQ